MLPTALFAGVSLLIFIIFLLNFPTDWQQPETMRIHYSALQQGVKQGPLNPAITGNDFLKPFSLLARGGTYEARYLVKLLDNLTVKASQALYPIVGPFLGEPLNVLLILITALLLVLAIQEWFSSWPAALIASGFWLTTSQTLLDARYPIRPNMALAALLSVYVIWQVLRLRRARRPLWFFIRIGLALFIAFSSQEYAIFLLPALGVIIFLERKSLRPNIKWLLISVVTAFAGFAVFFWILNPLLMKVLVNEEYSWIELQNASPLDLVQPHIFVQRLGDYTVRGLGEFFKLNLGVNQLISLWQRVAGAAAILAVLIIALPGGRRKIGGPLIMWGAFYLPVTLIMFPLLPASVEMPVYYYALILVLFIFPVGALLSSLPPKGKTTRWILVCLALLIIAGGNVATSAAVMQEIPSAFGFNKAMRQYVRDILNLEDYLREEKIPLPVYTAYPRPRRLDSSAKWDLMLRVWHGESERVFAMMMPVLYLKSYRDREFLGNRSEFYGLTGLSSSEYEKAASSLADLPARGWYNLAAIREDSSPPLRPPVWLSAAGRHTQGELDGTILGEAYRSVLPPGRWRTVLEFPRSSPVDSKLIFLARGDLQVEGSGDIYHRETPIPEKTLRIKVRDGTIDFSVKHSYGWSYRLYAMPWQEQGEKRTVSMEVINAGPAEIIGPLIVPASDVRFHPWPETTTKK